MGIGVNSTKLLHKIGVGYSCNAIAGRRGGVWFTFRRFDDGEEITTVMTPGEDKTKVRFAPMARSEFLDVLLEHVKERGAARLHTNKRCQDVQVCIVDIPRIGPIGLTCIHMV